EPELREVDDVRGGSAVLENEARLVSLEPTAAVNDHDPRARLAVLVLLHGEVEPPALAGSLAIANFADDFDGFFTGRLRTKAEGTSGQPGSKRQQQEPSVHCDDLKVGGVGGLCGKVWELTTGVGLKRSGFRSSACFRRFRHRFARERSRAERFPRGPLAAKKPADQSSEVREGQTHDGVEHCHGAT